MKQRKTTLSRQQTQNKLCHVCLMNFKPLNNRWYVFFYKQLQGLLQVLGNVH